jgi:hypothetical protein
MLPPGLRPQWETPAPYSTPKFEQTMLPDTV